MVSRNETKGHLIFVDDNRDELDLLTLAAREAGIPNPVHCFPGAKPALEYLKTTGDRIFLIISDINMPGMDGLEFKRMIELSPELKIKSIPFVYYTAQSSLAEIKTAYSLNIQGYMMKCDNIADTARRLRMLTDLWHVFVHPKDLESEV